MGEMKAMQGRHNAYISMFNKMGGYAPTMGIIGTVMGLIMTLANAGKDPNTLIHSIASAFIATLWGIFSANLLWLPIADKLKQCHLEEKYMMEVSLRRSNGDTKRGNTLNSQIQINEFIAPKRARYNRQTLDDDSMESNEEANSERYLLTYADLITLLLGLFIILYAVSNVDATQI